MTLSFSFLGFVIGLSLIFTVRIDFKVKEECLANEKYLHLHMSYIFNEGEGVGAILGILMCSSFLFSLIPSTLPV